MPPAICRVCKAVLPSYFALRSHAQMAHAAYYRAVRRWAGPLLPTYGGDRAYEFQPFREEHGLGRPGERLPSRPAPVRIVVEPTTDGVTIVTRDKPADDSDAA